MAVRFLLKSFTTRTPTPTRFPPLPLPPPHTTAAPLRPWLAPPAPFRPIPTPPHLLHPIPTLSHLLLTTRAFSSPGENTSPAVMFIKKITKRISDLMSWINIQSFPPTMKLVLHTIFKGMLFAAGEKSFEQLARVFFLLKEKLVAWCGGSATRRRRMR